MQAYSNPKRENDPYALPDVEVFYGCPYIPDDGFADGGEEYTDDEIKSMTGFYYWYCFPSCLPDSEPIGPFETEEQALSDAQSESWQFEDSGEDND